MRQKDVTTEYKGHSLVAFNINWSKHLDQAWQCNVNIFPDKSWRTEIFYGKTAEEVLDKAKKCIDNHPPKQ